jgi:preprotein translocase subunit SecG
MEVASVMSLVVNIIYLIICLAIIAIVLLQSGRSAGLSGSIAGGAETFFGKNKARAYEALLSKYTGWIAVLFVIVSIILVFLLRE